jgi:hypothetical protein
VRTRAGTLEGIGESRWPDLAAMLSAHDAEHRAGDRGLARRARRGT